jgi:hypothetical protein
VIHVRNHAFTSNDCHGQLTVQFSQKVDSCGFENDQFNFVGDSYEALKSFPFPSPEGCNRFDYPLYRAIIVF